MRFSGVWPPLALLAAGAGGPDAPPPPITWAQIAAQPAPPGGVRIAYGSDSLQFGELRLPAGRGPFALVVLIHGGCWQSAYGVDHVLPLAEALRREGFASWTIEYRRLGDDGGGWPGTFEDAARALDHVGALAAAYPIDRDRVVLLGHSAGGHLALWLASRASLPDSSVLAAPGALPVRGVVGLAAIADLAAYGSGSGSCNAAVYPLMGGTPEEAAGRYAEGDPMRMLPPGAPVRLVHGTLDPIVPLAQAGGYAEASMAAGGDVKVVAVAGAGHFDVIAPFAAAWRTVLNEVRAMAGEGSRR